MQDFIYFINTWALEGKWMWEGLKDPRAAEGSSGELHLQQCSASTSFSHSDPKMWVHCNSYDYPPARAIWGATTYNLLCRKELSSVKVEVTEWIWWVFCIVNYSTATSFLWFSVKWIQGFYHNHGYMYCTVHINSPSYGISHCSNAFKLTNLLSSLQIKILCFYL